MSDPSVERFRRVVEASYGYLEARRNELVHAVARAALMGARGNSGVILAAQ